MVRGKILEFENSFWLILTKANVLAAGLKPGDIILEYDGKPINDGNELPRYVAGTPVDKKVKLVIFREKKKQDVYVTVGKLKDAEAAAAVKGGGDSGSESEKISITVQELTKELADRMGIKDGKGLIITEVQSGSSAEEAGVAPGSIVIEVNGQRPETLESFRTLLSALKKDDVVRLLLKRRDGSIHYVAMKVD